MFFCIRICAHTGTREWTCTQQPIPMPRKTKIHTDGHGAKQTDTALWDALIATYGTDIQPVRVELTVVDAMAYDEYLIRCEENGEALSVNKMVAEIPKIWPFVSKLKGKGFLDTGLVAGMCPFDHGPGKFQQSLLHSNGGINKQVAGRHWRKIHLEHVAWCKYVYFIFV